MLDLGVGLRAGWICFGLSLAGASLAQGQFDLTGAKFHQLGRAGARAEGLPEMWVRPGYQVTRVAADLKNARFMEFDDKGRLYLSRPTIGDILVMTWDGKQFNELGILLTGKKSVHGMHWADGWLYYSTTYEIRRARDTSGDGVADEEEIVLDREKLGAFGGGHWWRPVLVTQDAIFTSIGDGGNINDESDSNRQKVWRFPKAGGDGKVWSTGIRNTEKLRLRPGTQEVWGMDHGSDNWGAKLGESQEKGQPFTDLNPPDEFNHYREGAFYGHPFITGNRVPRYEFMNRPDIVELGAKTEPPAWNFGSHWAMNGFTFLGANNAFGREHIGDAFCAAHGSWNSSVRVGYRVERVLFDKVSGRPYGSLAIVVLLGPENQVLGRPVDCVEAPDGSVLFSCDQTHSIYRISPSR